jgi:hypothetical protein
MTACFLLVRTWTAYLLVTCKLQITNWKLLWTRGDLNERSEWRGCSSGGWVPSSLVTARPLLQRQVTLSLVRMLKRAPIFVELLRFQEKLETWSWWVEFLSFSHTVEPVCCPGNDQQCATGCECSALCLSSFLGKCECLHPPLYFLIIDVGSFPTIWADAISDEMERHTHLPRAQPSVAL